MLAHVIDQATQQELVIVYTVWAIALFVLYAYLQQTDSLYL